MAAEAGAGAVEGEAAAAAGAGRSATSPARRASRARPAPAARPAAFNGSGRSQARAGGGPPPIAQTGPTTREFALEGAWPSSNYQGVILGEFVLAVLLVAATPFANKSVKGASPYAGRDMIQLLAITLLYFLLAVLAGSSHGMARFAAWFGGLILLVVGLAEAANIASAVSKYLNPGTSASDGGVAEGGGGPLLPGTGVAEGSAGPLLNPSVVNPPSTLPATGIARASAQQPGTGLA